MSKPVIDFTNEVVRVLTWKPPYSTLMLPPWYKKETRGNATTVRGWVVIHEGLKAFTEKELQDIAGDKQLTRINEALGAHMNSTELNGMCIAIGKLVDCRPMQPEDADGCFVEFNADKFVWIFEDVRHIKPFPRKGATGWAGGELTAEEKAKIVLI